MSLLIFIYRKLRNEQTGKSSLYEPVTYPNKIFKNF